MANAGCTRFHPFLFLEKRTNGQACFFNLFYVLSRSAVENSTHVVRVIRFHGLDMFGSKLGARDCLMAGWWHQSPYSTIGFMFRVGCEPSRSLVTDHATYGRVHVTMRMPRI